MRAPPNDMSNDTAETGPEAAERTRARWGDTGGHTLLIYDRDGARSILVTSGARVVIGRERPANVVVRDRSLSREHAAFSSTRGELWVEDLGSTNQTFVRGKPVERARLEPGDEVVLGAVVVAVHRLKPAESELFGLESDDRFHVRLEEEIVRARYFGRQFALLMVRASRVDASKLSTLDQWSPRVRALLAPVDRVALYASDILEILLPEAGVERATAVAGAIAGLREGAAGALVGGTLFPEGGASAHELIENARVAALSANTERPVNIHAPPARRRIGGAPGEPERVIGAGMQSLLEMARRVARSSVPVLLLGETGSGKEVVARAIHRDSKNSEGPLVCVNCAAISAQLLESTLFGHEKGAFTGASERRKGAFEAANGGTLFLDEIGELPLQAQATLLRAIETHRFARVGATEEIEVDVRVVAATNRDLDAMVAASAFRSDLSFRINTVTLRIPPLRDRAEDVPLLVEHFVREACAAHDAKLCSVDPQAMELLVRYPWPGNVRELKNAIERAIVLARDDGIATEDLPERIRLWASSAPSEAPAPVVSDSEDLQGRMKSLEAGIIREALERAGGNQTKAAQLLGVPRRTLVHKLRALGIKREQR